MKFGPISDIIAVKILFMLELKTIIPAIISFFLGGGFITLLEFLKKKKADDRSFAEKERNDLAQKVETLKNDIVLLTAQIVPSSFPVWLKDSSGKYLFVNQAWEIQIGARIGKFKHHVIGFSDDQIFENQVEFLKVIKEIDEEATAFGGVAVRTNVPFPKNIGDHLVIKEIVVRDLVISPVYRGAAIPVKHMK